MDRVAASEPGSGETSKVEENDPAGPAGPARPAVAPNDLIPLYQALIEADDRGDAAALARVGWILFAIASKAQHAQREALILLMELRAAASAVSAGNGSHASLALLRHVLATHGWLPPPNATPLQVLAGRTRP